MVRHESAIALGSIRQADCADYDVKVEKVVDADGDEEKVVTIHCPTVDKILCGLAKHKEDPEPMVYESAVVAIDTIEYWKKWDIIDARC